VMIVTAMQIVNATVKKVMTVTTNNALANHQSINVVNRAR